MNSAELLQQMMLILNVQNDPLQYEQLSCVILSVNVSDDGNSAFDRLANLVVLKSIDQDSCIKPENDGGESERNGE